MNPRLLLVTSTGGHLAQLVRLRSVWADHPRTWVTFDKPDAQEPLAGEDVIHAYHPTTRNVVNLARNWNLARKVIPAVRPDIVVSTGAGVAVPFFVEARRRGIPTVYVEVYDRIDSKTLTGRMCRPITSRFCVQWEEQRDLYRGSELIGQVL